MPAAMPWLTWIALLAALGSALALAARPRKSDAELLFAVFCGSLAMEMLRPWVPTDAGLLWWLVAIGGSATCNCYWLVARALFRGPGAVRLPHVAVSLGIALMIVVWRVASRDTPTPGDGWVASVGALLTLASSAVLILGFLEALKGWSAALPRSERRLRIGYMALYGGSVLAVTIAKAIAEASPAQGIVATSIASACAVAMVLYTHVALRQRRRHAWPPVASAHPTLSGAGAPATPRHNPTADDRRLAARIVRMLEHEQVYREPELKVADLAERLSSAEHKVSRAITRVLGERNFNQLLNRYRVAYACGRLEDGTCELSVIEISAESGFASLGPFNRAFKAAKGCTPSAYRVGPRLARLGSEHVNCE